MIIVNRYNFAKKGHTLPFFVCLGCFFANFAVCFSLLICHCTPNTWLPGVQNGTNFKWVLLLCPYICTQVCLNLKNTSTTHWLTERQRPQNNAKLPEACKYEKPLLYRSAFVGYNLIHRIVCCIHTCNDNNNVIIHKTVQNILLVMIIHLL